MFKFCASIGFGLMLVMGGAALAEDELSELNDPDTVFPESEPPYIEFTSPDPLLNPAVFPEIDPPFITPMPPVEFPDAPVVEDLGDLRVIQLNSDLFPPEDPRLMELIIPPVIPIIPEDGDYGDAAQAVEQAALATIGDDLIEGMTDVFPRVSNTLNQFGNFIDEHPYASAGLGAGALIVANVGVHMGLEEYGDNLDTNSVTIPIPAYQNPDFTIPFLDATIGLILGVKIQQNLTEPDWIILNTDIRF